ncbi:helix-turn-helix domain-containing protein [Nocardia terpenica]|uniref:helix-turn-helix domain-containing protein n=1 Tax=Nocardia terpenica TaxID=455432 RepID=UPI0018934D2B|nr:helix-turn-helix domain-containing protein [Nocardia terpenica]MBF6109165.1 helix-turn-helix domain-containing protein [Nocardia terpenica]
MTTDPQDVLRRVLTEPTVSVKDAARALGVGRSTLYAAVKSGEVPAIRVRNRLRIPSNWVCHMLYLDADPGGGAPERSHG